VNDKRQITLTQEELDCIGVKPGDAVEVWAEDGMEAIVIYKADGTNKESIAQ